MEDNHNVNDTNNKIINNDDKGINKINHNNNINLIRGTYTSGNGNRS